MFAKEAQKLAKPCYEALKKISKGKWEWKPEVGESYKLGNYKYLIGGTAEIDNILSHNLLPPNVAIPIFHWEKIEEILEGMGYYVRVLRNVDKDPNGNHLCECAIDRNEGHIAKVVDKTRQLAVMRAAIELGSEQQCKKH